MNMMKARLTGLIATVALLGAQAWAGADTSTEKEAFRVEVHAWSLLGVGGFHVSPKSQIVPLGASSTEATAISEAAEFYFEDNSSGNYDTIYLSALFGLQIERRSSDPRGVYHLHGGSLKGDDQGLEIAPFPQTIDLSSGKAEVKLQGWIRYYDSNTSDPWNPPGYYTTQPHTFKFIITRFPTQN